MKFPATIVLLLIVIATIGTFAINMDVNYNILDENQYISPEHGSIKIRTDLYFVYDDALRPETRSVTISDSNYEKAILDALAEGSNNNYFSSVFNLGIQIISVDLVHETCYINLMDTPELDALFLNERFDLYVWSVVNSLTENNQVKNVQFLIEGKQYRRSMQGYNFNSPLPKLESLVYSKEIKSADVVLEFIEYISTRRFDLAYSLLTKNSMNNFDYSAFIKYANTFNEKHRDFTKDTYYSRVYAGYEEVFIKFTKQYETDGFMLNTYDKWTVILEDDVFRINLNSN
jgi:hypothetical protein